MWDDQITFFLVEFGFENLPQICSFCKFVGHSVEKCRRAKAIQEKEDPPSDVNPAPGVRNIAAGDKDPKPPPKPIKQWRAKNNRKNPVEQYVETTNPYASLQEIEEEEPS